MEQKTINFGYKNPIETATDVAAQDIDGGERKTEVSKTSVNPRIDTIQPATSPQN